jgi:ethanolamine utilization protein EutQ
MGKRIIAVVDVLDAAKAGSKTIPALAGECIVTAGAREKAEELGIIIADGCESPQPLVPPATAVPRIDESETVVREVCALLKGRVAYGVEPGKLEHLVREVVSAKLVGAAAVFPTTGDPSASRVEGVCFISGSRLLDSGAGPVPVTEKALVSEVIRCGEDHKLAGGYMQWEKASFSRTVEFPEIGVVIEGELHLTVGGKTLIGKPGDMVYFPKGVQVTYSTPSRVKLACVNCIL